MFLSVVIPTYNRRPILEKCIKSLENQVLAPQISDFEIVIVDDGSTDGTVEWINDKTSELPHVRLFQQEHGGAALGRNLGVENSRGEVIIFIDSDLVVVNSFLAFHANSLINAWSRRGDKLCFTYGRVINTNNFHNPTSEPYKLQDISLAYFATGNVAIDKLVLQKAGLFDTSFCLYGWEDLELGERLRKMNVDLIKCPRAIGYHWHPPLSIDQIPQLIRIECERAKMGLIFYKKHPSLRVRFIIQFTFIHRFLWNFLTLGGIINERTIKPLLAFLIRNGYPGIALELLRIPLNRIGVEALYKEASLLGLN